MLLNYKKQKRKTVKYETQKLYFIFETEIILV